MNLGQIVKRVQRQFGDESEVELTRDDIVNYANDGQMDIVRHTEVLQELIETDAIASQAKYILPSDFLKMKRVTFEGKKIIPIALEDIDNVPEGVGSSNTTTGDPRSYYIWGNELVFHPTPSKDSDGAIDMFYIKAPNPITLDEDIPEIPSAFHEDLVRYCLGRAKELDEEFDDSQRILGDYHQRVNFSKDDHKTPDISTYPSVRLVSGDDW